VDKQTHIETDTLLVLGSPPTTVGYEVHAATGAAWQQRQSNQRRPCQRYSDWL